MVKQSKATEVAVMAAKDLQSFFSSDGMKQRVKMALPAHMTEDRMIRIALSACARNPVLYECDKNSLGISLIRAAEMGVEVDGVEAALVPFKEKGVYKCQLITMFQGLAKLAYQSELVLSIQAGVVREGDEFKWKLGTQAFLDHYPGDDPDAPMTHAWACAQIKGGGWPFVVLNRTEVMRHKAASKAAGSSFSPWNNKETEPAMWQKTAVRMLAKLLPKSATLRSWTQREDALDMDADIIDGVIQATNGEAEEGEPVSQSDELANELEARKAKPQDAADPVAKARAELLAAGSEAEARRIYDAYCGPDSALNQEAAGRVSNLWEMRVAELRGAEARKSGSLFEGQQGNAP
jgi:recombination protein RecT